MTTFSLFYKSVFTSLMLHKSFPGPLSFHFPICFPSRSVRFHLWMLPLLFNYNMSITKGAASPCYILKFVIRLWEAMVNSVESRCMPECLSKNLCYRSGRFHFYFDNLKCLLLICKSEISFQLQKEHQKLDALTSNQNILKYFNLSKSCLL